MKSADKLSLMKSRVFFILLSILFSTLAQAEVGDIIFVGQIPEIQDFATIGSTFANHGAAIDEAPRGGGLFIRYADGTIRDLTALAGYGVSGFQGAQSIAVRDPAVHWSGQKIVFSMVIGGATQRYQVRHFNWQLYEMSNLGRNEVPIILKVLNQPANYNNVMPVYGTDDRIIFASDRPRNGEVHLYPQRDEYESTKTNTGLWSLNPVNGNLFLLDHAPSGAFHPILDSFGRVLFTRWDHLQRDQQAGGLTDYGAFNYSSESIAATKIDNQNEVFPEPRSERERVQSNLNLHSFNHFFPWQINEDGTGLETLNHIGRHELHGYFDKTFNDDENLEEYYGQLARFNSNNIENFFQIKEDPLNPGTYFGVDCPEFQTHASGQIVKINGNPTTPADQMSVTYVTPRATARTSDNPPANHSGLYRNPLPLSNGALIASHTSETRADANLGTSNNPIPRYQYRIKTLRLQSGFYQPDTFLTPGISRAVSYWSPDELITYSGDLWELQPVELVARNKPTRRVEEMESPELSVFQEEGVDLTNFRNFLSQNSLALIVSRNITSRDLADVQQPQNIRVAGTATSKIPFAGKIYDVSHLQIFQGDLLRGYGGVGSNTSEGRRVLATPLHSSTWANPTSNGPTGSVKVASDGSVAAIVPARRALTWQLTAPDTSGVIRERYWLTFQPGEIRVCASCHGVNSHDQLGGSAPLNKPKALRDLLSLYKINFPSPPNNPDDPGIPIPDPPTPQNPEPPVDDGGNPQISEPTYVFKFSSVKRKKVINGFLSGWTGLIETFGGNGPFGNKRLSVVLSVEGTSCSRPINTLTVNSAGYLGLRGSLPSVSRNTVLNFKVMENGISRGSSDIVLFNGKNKQKQKPLSKKEALKICKAFDRF